MHLVSKTSHSPGDVSEFITAPTPPAVWMSISVNEVDLEPKTTGTPARRRNARFDGEPAVASASTPAAAQTWIVASPTPPAPEWTSTCGTMQT